MTLRGLIGVNITVVEAGTAVGKDHDGNDMIVTDESAVFNGPRAWVTQKVYDALRALESDARAGGGDA